MGQETKLSISDECFRLMVESVEDYAIFMLDSSGRVASWNAGAARSHGYRAEEIIGRHFSCFYAPEAVLSGKPEQVLSLAVAKGRYEDEGWRMRKDGSRFWANVVITASEDEAGHLRGFAEVSRDLTERKRAEEALRAAAKRYRHLFERNLAGVFLSTTQGRILDCNEAFVRILGYASREEVLALTASEFHYDSADREVFLARLQEERTLTNAAVMS
jgi:PAS domain S-box-containing protein